MGGVACLVALVLLTVLLASMNAGVSAAESGALLLLVVIGGPSVVAARRMHARHSIWELAPRPTRTRVELLAAAVLAIGLVALVSGAFAIVLLLIMLVSEQGR